jgi:putative addiction module component (TIGR02574 family)
LTNEGLGYGAYMKKDSNLLSTIDSLPVDEKASLVNYIWDSLYRADKDIEEAWVKESDRRWKSFRQGKTKVITLDEFKKRLGR